MGYNPKKNYSKVVGSHGRVITPFIIGRGPHLVERARNIGFGPHDTTWRPLRKGMILRAPNAANRSLRNGCVFFPRNPVIFSVDDWGVQSPPKRKVFRFHYHSEKVIGSLGFVYPVILGERFGSPGMSRIFPILSMRSCSEPQNPQIGL